MQPIASPEASRGLLEAAGFDDRADSGGLSGVEVH
jgi:hypothetical protein